MQIPVRWDWKEPEEREKVIFRAGEKKEKIKFVMDADAIMKKFRMWGWNGAKYNVAWLQR